MTDRKRRELDIPEQICASPKDVAHAKLNTPVPSDWNEFEEELKRKHQAEEKN